MNKKIRTFCQTKNDRPIISRNFLGIEKSNLDKQLDISGKKDLRKIIVALNILGEE